MSIDVAALTDKQIAFEALRLMPETVTLQEISDELAILAAIRRGKEDSEAGRSLTHEEVKRRSAAWITR